MLLLLTSLLCKTHRECMPCSERQSACLLHLLVNTCVYLLDGHAGNLENTTRMTKQDTHSKTTSLSLLVKGKPDVLHGTFDRCPFSIETLTPGSHTAVASSLLAPIWYAVFSYQLLSVVLYCMKDSKCCQYSTVLSVRQATATHALQV